MDVKWRSVDVSDLTNKQKENKTEDKQMNNNYYTVVNHTSYLGSTQKSVIRKFYWSVHCFFFLDHILIFLINFFKIYFKKK